MIVDTSAIVAIFFQEPGYETLLDSLQRATMAGVAGPTLLEASIVLGARLGRDARPLLRDFLEAIDAEVIAFGEAHWREAASAWLRYGKGRHPAALNFGDCVSYAVARVAGEALLYVGDDFARTDVAGV